MFSLEGNSMSHKVGLQMDPTVLKNDDNAQTVRLDVTFTSFSVVFGGACEKYIPLAMLEGMEIHLQLENVQSAILYQWIPEPTAVTYPVVAGTTCQVDLQGQNTIMLLKQSLSYPDNLRMKLVLLQRMICGVVIMLRILLQIFSFLVRQDIISGTWEMRSMLD